MKALPSARGFVIVFSLAFATALAQLPAAESSVSPPGVQATPDTSPPPLSPAAADVLKMSRAKVGDGVILAYVQNSGLIYELNAAQIVYLRDAGVSESVISTMLNQRGRYAASAATAQAQQPAVQQEPAAQQQPVYTTSPAPSTDYGYSYGYPYPVYYGYSYSYWPWWYPFYWWGYYPYYYHSHYYPYYYGHFHYYHGPFVAHNNGFVTHSGGTVVHTGAMFGHTGGMVVNHGGFSGGFHAPRTMGGFHTSFSGGGGGFHGGFAHR